MNNERMPYSVSHFLPGALPIIPPDDEDYLIRFLYILLMENATQKNFEDALKEIEKGRHKAAVFSDPAVENYVKDFLKRLREGQKVVNNENRF